MIQLLRFDHEDRKQGVQLTIRNERNVVPHQLHYISGRRVIPRPICWNTNSGWSELESGSKGTYRPDSCYGRNWSSTLPFGLRNRSPWHQGPGQRGTIARPYGILSFCSENPPKECHPNSHKLTTKRRWSSRDKLGEVIPPHRLQRRAMFVEETSRCDIHVVRVPRFRPVVKHVASMPRPAIRAVIHGIEVVDASNDVRCQRRIIHDQLIHPIVEGRRLFRGR